MELVDIGDQDDREHDEEDDVTEDEIRSEHAQLGNLAKELETRLRHCVPAHSVPLARPPSNVGGVGFEFAGKGEGNDELEEEALDCNNGDHTGKALDEVEPFQEHHGFEEREEHDDGNGMGNSGQDSTELLATHA